MSKGRTYLVSGLLLAVLAYNVVSFFVYMPRVKFRKDDQELVFKAKGNETQICVRDGDERECYDGKSIFKGKYILFHMLPSMYLLILIGAGIWVIAERDDRVFPKKLGALELMKRAGQMMFLALLAVHVTDLFNFHDALPHRLQDTASWGYGTYLGFVSLGLGTFACFWPLQKAKPGYLAVAEAAGVGAPMEIPADAQRVVSRGEEYFLDEHAAGVAFCAAENCRMMDQKSKLFFNPKRNEHYHRNCIPE